MTHLARLGRFTLAVFPPHVYVTYAVLWVLALEGSAALLAGGAWHPSAGTAARALSVVLALLYLRIVDEQKDLDYDRVHSPDRPLVTGAVSGPELRGAMAAIALALVVLNWRLSAAALAVLLVDLGYAVLLVVIERRSARVREGLLLNLAVTYPVQLLLSVFVLISATAETGLNPGWRAVPLMAVFACVFLHFEFARKTAWSGAGRLYSRVLGPARSARLAAGFALAAAALTLALLPPWRPAWSALPWALLPYTALAFPAAGLGEFLLRRVTAWRVPLAMGFVVTTYLALTLQAAAR